MRVSSWIVGGYVVALLGALAIGVLSQVHVGAIGGDLAEIGEEWLENDLITGALAALRHTVEHPDRRGELTGAANSLAKAGAPRTGEDAQTEEHEGKEHRLLEDLRALLERAADTPPAGLPAIEDRAQELALAFWNEDRGRVPTHLATIQTRNETLRRLNLAAAAGILVTVAAVLAWLRRRILVPLGRLHGRVMEIGGVPDEASPPSGGLQRLETAIETMADAVTERRRALEQQVETRTAQLQHADRLGGIGRVAAAVAHEINNPLGSIGLCVEGLRTGLAHEGVERAELERSLAVISTEIERCTRTTQKLLTYAHYRPQEPTETPVDRLLQEAVDIVDAHARRHGVTVDAADTTAGATVLGDAGQLRQVVVNLLLNAIDASPRKGIVAVEAAARDGRVVVRVHDQGPGVPENARARIFEPFFTTKRPGEGTGLGLSISREIVESHGGTLDVGAPSEGRAGAVFELSLPEHREERA